MTNAPPITFFLPPETKWQDKWHDDMPNNTDWFWEGFGRGVYCWTLQTYLNLRSYGFDCTLSKNTLPDEGIIFAHRDSIPDNYHPNNKQLIICIKADRFQHNSCPIHIVQNPLEVNILENSYFMPLWPQPGLIHRDSLRGNIFKNIVYHGVHFNLAPEIKTKKWEKELKDLGLNWITPPRSKWHDYSQADALVAIRSFERQENYLWKPATKLYNAWHAGIPAILGQEPAYEAEKKSELDFITVRSFNEAILQLKKLRDTPTLRNEMIENGFLRAKETEKNLITEKWIYFINEIAIPFYWNWNKKPQIYFTLYTHKRFIKEKLYSLKACLHKSA